jgi:hypothetical protein
MPSFTFSYKEQVHHSFVAIFMDGPFRRYRVSVDNGYCILAPSGTPGLNQEIIWLQFSTPRSTLQTYDRLQSIGLGMQHAGLITAR